MTQVKSAGAMGVQGILNQREKTHGNYSLSADLAQALKVRFRAALGASRLLPYQQEAAEMILFKLARIASGNSNHADHWRDIAGYATLVVSHLEPATMCDDCGEYHCVCRKHDSLSPDDRYEG